jgi:hypothetical protein
MTPKKMINGMNLINRCYSSKQAHGGHFHFALGSAKYMTNYGVPQEGRTMKCHI